MKIGAAFPGQYIKAADLQGKRVQVTIERVEMEDIGGETKPVLHFRGKDRGPVQNKTTANAVWGINGSDDTDDWPGTTIVLYPSKTDFQGKRVDCIHVDPSDAAQPKRRRAPRRGWPGKRLDSRRLLSGVARGSARRNGRRRGPHRPEACRLPRRLAGTMAKPRKRRTGREKLPTPVLIGGLVGLVLIGIGLIALTAQRGTDVSTLPYPDIPRVSPTEAYQRQQAGTAVLVDVRDDQLYQESHAAGAISVPEEDLLARLGELSADKTLILY